MKHIYNLIIGLGLTIFLTAHAAQTDINGPAGSGNFGNTVMVLPNGNIVVTDPLYDTVDGTADVGAATFGSQELLDTARAFKDILREIHSEPTCA